MRTLDSDPLSVTQLNRVARDLLEQSIGLIWVKGELTACSIPASGHWYFTLKDELSQISCALFKHKAPTEVIAVGTEVVVCGVVTLYEPRGQYQMKVESIAPWGVGQRQQLFEALKQKLADEGLLALERKRALPRFPRCIGIISSEHAAGFQDVLVILKRRYPLARIRLYPSLVQGNEAPYALMRALGRACQDADRIDVLMVVRGGGNPEDLWCFNDESWVRALAQSPVPTVTGIGHEIDMTLSDWVADYRAPTPSAAAEAVVPDQKDIFVFLDQIATRLKRDRMRRFEHYWMRLDRVRMLLQTPRLWVQRRMDRLEQLRMRSVRIGLQYIERKRYRLEHLTWRLLQIKSFKGALRHETMRMRFALFRTAWYERHVYRLGVLRQRLLSHDPEVLFRHGWAWARYHGASVRSIHDLKVGEPLELWVRGGHVELSVLQVHPYEDA